MGAAVPTSRVQVFTFSQLEVCSLWSTQPAVLCHTRTVFIHRLKHSPDLSLNIKVKLKDHSSDMEEIWCPSQRHSHEVTDICIFFFTIFSD